MTKAPSPAPHRYNVDRVRLRLGDGEKVFQSAVAALRTWRMFDQGWIKLYSTERCDPFVGQIVAAVVRIGPVWWANASRVVYLLDESAPVRRIGFAYGTLPGHAERGEERFSVEIAADGGVWYDVLAYSQPRHWAPRLGYPLTRLLQRRFGRGSARAMHRAVVE